MSLVRSRAGAGVERRSASLALIPGPLEDSGAGPTGLVTTNSAHRHSAVWAASTMRSNLMGAIPLGVYKGELENRLQLPTPAVLIEPAADMEIDEFSSTVEWCLTLRGNAYAHVVDRDYALYPRRVELLHPDLVWADYDERGNKRYRANGRQLEPSDVLHIRRNRPPQAAEGMSALTYARKAIMTGLAAEDFGARFFTDGGHPTALLKAAKAINDTAAKTAKARFMAALNGRREPVVLGGDWTYEQIQVNPEDSQFIETMQANDVVIARFLGVPATMIDASAPANGSITYQSRESRAIDFLTFYMLGAITRYEKWLGRSFTPRGQYVRLNTDVMLRADAETSAKVNRIRLFNAEVNPNELRAGQGKGPILDGDIFPWPPPPPLLPMNVPVPGT